MVWLFSKQLTAPDGSPNDKGVIVADSGPCDVTGTRWTCTDVGTGDAGSGWNGTYTLWVTVLDPSRAIDVVNHLRHNGGAFDFSLQTPPKIDGAGAMDQTDVLRRWG